MSDPHCSGATPDDLAAIAAWNLGLHDAALMHARAALTFAPDDARLQDNLALIENGKETAQSVRDPVASPRV